MGVAPLWDAPLWDALLWDESLWLPPPAWLLPPWDAPPWDASPRVHRRVVLVPHMQHACTLVAVRDAEM